MDSFTLNKVAGAVLGTCLVGMGIQIAAQAIYEPGPPSKPGYELPNPKPESAAGGEKKPEVLPIAVRLQKADPKKGEADAKVCSACHNFEEGAGPKVGPDLYGVVDRPKGKQPGFDYSAGMKAKGGNWTFADIDDFITKPSAYVQGTKMGYPGQENPDKRADVIAYLRTLSKSPVPLPQVTEADKKEEAAAAGGGKTGATSGAPDFTKLVAAADPKKGEADAQVCSACHILKKGGGVLVGPPLWDVVDRKKGSVPGFDYSAGLKAKGGTWTIDDLNTWLTKPSAYIPGTKMGYPGEADEKKRAQIVAYLRTLSDHPVALPTTEASAKPEPATASGGKTAETTKPAGDQAAAGDADLLKLVGAADPKKGQADAQVCSACHNLKKGGGALIGPPLWDVVGRKKGSIPGFDYSAGLKAKGGDWTIGDLNTWLTKPSAYIPGTKMGYPGESDQKKRAQIIAYLRTLSDHPIALPNADEGARKAAAPHAGEANNMPPGAKPGDQNPPAPPNPPGAPQPTPKAPEATNAANGPKTPDAAQPSPPPSAAAPAPPAPVASAPAASAPPAAPAPASPAPAASDKSDGK